MIDVGRLEKLETTVAYQEQAIEDLNKTVLEQVLREAGDPDDTPPTRPGPPTVPLKAPDKQNQTRQGFLPMPHSHAALCATASE